MSYLTVSEIGTKSIRDVKAVAAQINSRVTYGLYAPAQRNVLSDVAFRRLKNILWFDTDLPIHLEGTTDISIDIIDTSGTTASIISTVNKPSIQQAYGNRQYIGIPAYMNGGKYILANSREIDDNVYLTTTCQIGINCDLGWSSLESRSAGTAIKAGESYLDADNNLVLQEVDGTLAADSNVIVPDDGLNRLALTVAHRMANLYNPNSKNPVVDLFDGWEGYLQWLS